MSRVGKKTIQIPKDAEVKIDNNKVTVKGPGGEISKEFRPEVKIEVKGDKISVSPEPKSEKLKKTKALWGLSRMLVANMIQGVTTGFEKKLEIHGIGYKAEVAEKEVILYVGFSHPVKLKIPEGIKVLTEKNIITVSGIDKEVVGQLASTIRKVRPTEPYKGKGIKYVGETVRKKVGKKVATTVK